MDKEAAANIVPFKARAASNNACGPSRTLDPKEVHTLSMLIRRVAGELKTDEADLFEITQRVFGICDLRHIPAQDLEAVVTFLTKLPLSSRA